MERRARGGSRHARASFDEDDDFGLYGIPAVRTDHIKSHVVDGDLRRGNRRGARDGAACGTFYALPYGWNVSIVVPSVQSFAPPVLPTLPVEPSYVLPMRTERAMPSNAMFRLFMTDCSACAFLFAFTSARSAPTETTITMENSPMATIISTRVKPRE